MSATNKYSNYLICLGTPVPHIGCIKETYVSGTSSREPAVKVGNFFFDPLIDKIID